MAYLVDTDVLIDHLQGNKGAADFLLKLDNISVSAITVSELLAGIPSDAEEYQRVFRFAYTFPCLDVGCNDAKLIGEIRSRISVKLPDCVIAATALLNGHTLVSWNAQDFGKIAKFYDLDYQTPSYSRT